MNKKSVSVCCWEFLKWFVWLFLLFLAVSSVHHFLASTRRLTIFKNNFERIGFPFVFFTSGGISFHKWFSFNYLCLDLGIGLSISLIGSSIVVFVFRFRFPGTVNIPWQISLRHILLHTFNASLMFFIVSQFDCMYRFGQIRVLIIAAIPLVSFLLYKISKGNQVLVYHVFSGTLFYVIGHLINQQLRPFLELLLLWPPQIFLYSLVVFFRHRD